MKLYILSITTTKIGKKMNEQTFYNLVRKYREAEKMYSRTKHYVYASDLVSLGREIDDAIKINEEEQVREREKSLDFNGYMDSID